MKKKIIVNNQQISIDGLNIYYQTAGNEKNRTVVFLHGWGARKNNICGKGKERVISGLSKHFYVIAPELPGLVRSQPPNTVWSLEHYAKFIHTLIKTLAVAKPIIMGQSFGGGIATTYADLYPNDTPILILIDASQGNRLENWYYRLRFKWKIIFDNIIGGRYLPLFIKKIMISPWLGVPWTHITKKNAAKYLIMTNIETTYKVRVDYHTLKMPVLMIWGENDTIVTPLQQAKKIASDIHKSKLIVIPSAGHLALYTQTDKVINEIAQFVKSN